MSDSTPEEPTYPPFDFQQYAGIGASNVFFQRQHQFDLGYGLNHDAEHHDPETLARVGSCYIEFGVGMQEGIDQDKPHPFWPQDSGIEWHDEDTPTEYIIKGAAFILASLDLEHALRMKELYDEHLASIAQAEAEAAAEKEEDSEDGD